jgi:serine/threonine protein kinase
MAKARQETMFAAAAGHVLEDAALSSQNPASDVELLRQQVIMHLLEQLPMVPAALQAMFSRLMQSGILTSEAVSSELKYTPETVALPAIRRSESKPVSLPSRFDQDFERLELLGRGAFGEVWRCRHRLDGREYAIKAVQYRVGADAGQMEQHVLREASTWACLSHPNILRYHNSWAEVDQNHNVEEEHNPESSPSPLTDELMAALSINTSGPHTADLVDEWSFEESDGGVVFEESKIAAQPQSPAPQHAAALPDSAVFPATTATHHRLPSAVAHQDMPVVPGYRATLYLQAELCRTDTLMAWIAQRNVAKASGLMTLQDHRRWADQGLNIFRQIVVGLAHLHKHRCAHRDVKPSNILFGYDGNVRLGDFGLAKFLEDTRPLALRDDESSSSPQQGKSQGAAKLQHTHAVGTPSYASPEQLEGRSCGVETDVYALGMILAELLCPVSTHMERVALLEGLRNDRKILGKAASALPIAARLAVAMTSPDPMQRPLMCEILEVYPEVEREVILCFGSETASLSSPLAASPTTNTSAVEATERDSTTAAVDSLHEPPQKAFAARCDEAASSRCWSKKEPAQCNSSTACQSASEQILVQEQQASQMTEKTEEVMDSAKVEDTVKELTSAPAAHAAGAAHLQCWYWPKFALSTPRAVQPARAGYVEPDKAAQRHDRRDAVTPQGARQTAAAATLVPSTRGRRGRHGWRRCCNGLAAPPIKHFSLSGCRHSVAALPPFSAVGAFS